MSVSTSSPGPGNQPTFAPELIEKEIEHLKKRQGVRYTQETKRAKWKIAVTLAVLALIWLYTMDVFLFSYNRGDAIRTYLYLHNYGNDKKAQEVAASGLLTEYEVTQLNRRQGSFQDYFTGTVPAEQKAAELVTYMEQVHALQEGKFDSLSPVNKVRYCLFVKIGLTPPTRWQVLNSSIDK